MKHENTNYLRIYSGMEKVCERKSVYPVISMILLFAMVVIMLAVIYIEL